MDHIWKKNQIRWCMWRSEDRARLKLAGLLCCVWITWMHVGDDDKDDLYACFVCFWCMPSLLLFHFIIVFSSHVAASVTAWGVCALWSVVGYVLWGTNLTDTFQTLDIVVFRNTKVILDQRDAEARSQGWVERTEQLWVRRGWFQILKNSRVGVKR